MKRAWLVILLLLSVGLNLGLILKLARRGDADRPVTHELSTGIATERLGRLADRFDLAGEERGRFIELHVEFLDTLREERGELEEVRRTLRVEMTATHPDQDRIEELVAASGRHLTALELALARTVLASRELLDGEAERHYLRLIAELRARRFSRWRRE